MALLRLPNGQRIDTASTDDLKRLLKELSPTEYTDLLRDVRKILNDRALGMTDDQTMDRVRKAVDDEQQTLNF